MGFPGKLTVHVRYTLRAAKLHIDYLATTTRATVLNLTNHTYFNLAGQASGDVLQQEISIDADRFTPVDSRLIPTGAEETVEDTPFDFRKLRPIGERILDNDEQLKRAGGYDQNFILKAKPRKLRQVAKALDPESGRTLTVRTTQPGLQSYSGNFLDGSVAA